MRIIALLIAATLGACAPVYGPRDAAQKFVTLRSGEVQRPYAQVLKDVSDGFKWCYNDADGLLLPSLRHWVHDQSDKSATIMMGIPGMIVSVAVELVETGPATTSYKIRNADGVEGSEMVVRARVENWTRGLYVNDCARSQMTEADREAARNKPSFARPH